MNEPELKKNIANQPELAISLYEKITGKNASITYNFKDMKIQVPDRVGRKAIQNPWQVDGTLTISTTEKK